jgi:hypothetical protein
MAVKEVYGPVGKSGIVLGVRHHDDRRTFVVEFREELDHFQAVFTV